MINQSIFVLVLFSALNSFADHHSPENTFYNSSNNIKLVVLKKLARYKLKTSIETGTNYNGRKVQSIEIGSYYKLKANQRVGLFLVEAQGERHTDDWILKNNDWLWDDTSERKEYKLQFVYSKKLRSSNSSPFIYEFKNTLQSSSYQSQSLYILKPSIHYFKISNGRPIWSARLELPMYFPLNYEENLIYKNGYYTALLYHFSRKVSLGLNMNLLTETWTESEEFKKAKPDYTYEVKDTIQQYGLRLIFSL